MKRLMRTRKRLESSIIRHITSPDETSDGDVELVSELIFALTWSRETHEFARKQMADVVAFNGEERQSSS